MKTTELGMSLIELIIVVAIVGILGVLAYPSYQQHLIKTRKADGLSIINKVMQAQEKFYVNTLTYTTNLTQLGFASANNLASEEGYYLVTAVSCGGGISECVNITTTAQGPQITGNAAEDNLSLNSQGVKSGKWPNDY